MTDENSGGNGLISIIAIIFLFFALTSSSFPLVMGLMIVIAILYAVYNATEQEFEGCGAWGIIGFLLLASTIIAFMVKECN